MSARHSTRLRDAALAAAEAGLYVFPCSPYSKVPALHGAGQCEGLGVCAQGHLGWEQRATRDPDLIAATWATRPWNIGAAVGRSGLIVIDLDHGRGETPPLEFAGAASGIDVLEMLAQRAGQPAPWDTYSVESPTGGLHLYYRAPAGHNFRNTAGSAGLGWKIDTRGHGGFIVAAGSVRHEGRYRVVNDRPISELPAWLVEALTKPASISGEHTARIPAPTLSPDRHSAYLRKIVADEAATVRSVVYGQGRNHALNRAAFILGRLVGGAELDETEARHVLLNAAAGHFGIKNFTEAEALRTIDSGIEAGKRQPRTLR